VGDSLDVFADDGDWIVLEKADKNPPAVVMEAAGREAVRVDTLIWRKDRGFVLVSVSREWVGWKRTGRRNAATKHDFLRPEKP
jgi:hypothetical protein